MALNFGDYSCIVDTIGETKDYLLISYQINSSVTHTERFNGITPKNDTSVTYKLKMNNGLFPSIINDSLAIVSSEYYLIENEGCWIEKISNNSYKPIQNENGESINLFGIETEKLKKGIYFYEKDKLILVDNISNNGYYYLTKYSIGIEEMISIDKLINGSQ